MNSNSNTIIHSTIDDGYDFLIADNWDKQYHFKISTFSVPSGLLSEAMEVIDTNKENEPRTFHILSDFEADMEKAEMLLKAKVKKGINQKHLICKSGRLEIGADHQLRGRIDWNDDNSDSKFDTMFVIDGKRITIEKFVELIDSFSGFNFKIKIYDSTDDMD
jgi:hypothetical protein